MEAAKSVGVRATLGKMRQARYAENARRALASMTLNRADAQKEHRRHDAPKTGFCQRVPVGTWTVNSVMTSAD